MAISSARCESAPNRDLHRFGPKRLSDHLILEKRWGYDCAPIKAQENRQFAQRVNHLKPKRGGVKFGRRFTIDELQADLDTWISEYNKVRPHQGRWCFGKTPMQALLDAMPMTKEKIIAA
jgi:hypothetical protein